MEEAGFFPTDRNQVYDLPDDELFLVGTSEVPLSALNRGIAPRRRRAARSGTPASPRNFRREAGTYGKDTRGHLPGAPVRQGRDVLGASRRSQSWEEHERILAIEESIVGGLGLPYRVTNIAAGDLGAPAAKKYDIEVWLPSEGRYRELTSCSNYLDFSARRLRTRVRGDVGHRARAHPERHRLRDQPHARVPLRALPAGRTDRSRFRTSCVPFTGFSARGSARLSGAMSLGPNDRCWCGSEQKYKKCHRLRDEPVKPGKQSPIRPVPDDIDRPPYIANGGEPADPQRAAGEAARHRRPRCARRGSPRVRCSTSVGAASRAGGHDRRARRGRARRRTSSGVATRARSATAGFPKSVCTSVNEVICHGIPDDQVAEGRRHRQRRRHDLPRRRARRHERDVRGRRDRRRGRSC